MAIYREVITEVYCDICGEKSWSEYDFCSTVRAEMRKQRF